MKKKSLKSRINFLLFFFSILTIPVLAAAATKYHRLQPVENPQTAENFTLTNLEGETVRLSDFQGRVVVVNFWATWCPPCRLEIPSMRRAWKQIKDQDVMMLAVHEGGKTGKVESFAKRFKMNFPVLHDTKSEVYKAWPTGGYPSTFVVSPDGRIVYEAIGGRKWDSPGIIQAILDLRQKS